MIYTSYEMIQDCQAGKPEGWAHFVTHYVPVVQLVLAHYDAGRAIEPALAALHEQKFAGLQPSPERPFVAWLRQQVMAAPAAESEIPLSLATLHEALEALTVVEKEAVWLESMGYSSADAGRMLRMDPATVEKIRARASELIRDRVGRWRRTLLAENGFALGREAEAQTTPDCVSVQALLDMIDGRATWTTRRVLELHTAGCWHCVDHFCRMHEVCDLLRAAKPLTEAEAQGFYAAFGIAPKKSFWGKLRGGAS